LRAGFASPDTGCRPRTVPHPHIRKSGASHLGRSRPQSLLENANFVVLAFWWLVQSCGGFFAAEGTRVFCCLGRNRRIVAKLPELLKTHRYGQCLQVTTRPVLSSRTFTHHVAFAVSSQSQVKRLGGCSLRLFRLNFCGGRGPCKPVAFRLSQCARLKSPWPSAIIAKGACGETPCHRKSLNETPTSDIAGGRKTFAHRHQSKAKEVGLGSLLRR
jgi:hypothetical protein